MPTFQTIAGAVNGIPTTRGVRTDGADLQTINIADNGSATTLNVNTDGNPPNEGAVNHRVAFIGGTTSGRDHFPWAVIDGPDPSVAPYFPITLSLEQAMRWTWRVKEWGVSGQFSFRVTRDSDGTYGDYTVDYAMTLKPYYLVSGGPNPPVGSEPYLVVLFGVVVFVNSSSISNGFPGTPAPIFFANGMGMLDSSYPSLVSDSGQLKPEIDLTTEVQGTPDSGGASSFSFTLSSVNPGGATTVASGLLIDGIPVDLYYTTETDSCSISNFAISDLSADPVEFWPYAAKDGSAIYDTSTGAQLQDPLSGGGAGASSKPQYVEFDQ